MTKFDPDAPVLVAVGEASRKSLTVEWPSPADLAGAAIRQALADSGAGDALGAAIDCVAAIRTFEDSGLAMGTGSPDNVPHAYADAAGISAAHHVYADIGGQSPQALVSEFAGKLRAGQHKAVLIAGAEAIGTAKRARKAGVELDWHVKSDQPFENRLSDFPILDRAEIRHGIVSMPLAYSLIENARAAAHPAGRAAYMRELAKLWSAFSDKSLLRDHAQFARHWDADALLDGADGNYPMTDIFSRWMVAQDAVDVGAAIIMTTAGHARALGIGDDRMIWLAGAANAAEVPVSIRSDIAGSDALQYAIDASLDQAGLDGIAIGPVDIYSCFPCAVFAGIDALGGDRPYGDYTLTGGLSFFGGPGNGYSMHAIAAMVETLRGGQKGAFGMVTANGGVMSKQSVGIYSNRQPDTAWAGDAHNDYNPRQMSRDDSPFGPGHIVSMVQGRPKGVGGDVILLVGLETGARALAILESEYDPDLVGRPVMVTAGEKRHIARLA